jgi:hypothetical protein
VLLPSVVVLLLDEPAAGPKGASEPYEAAVWQESWTPASRWSLGLVFP